MSKKVNVEKLLSLWNNGFTRKEISENLNLHVDTVSKHLNTQLDYVERRSSIDKLIHLDMDKVKELREKRYTAKQIARELNISDTSLYSAGMASIPFKRQGVHTYPKDLEFFNEIDSSEKAYIIGFLITDGSITNRGDVRIEIEVKAFILGPLTLVY